MIQVAYIQIGEIDINDSGHSVLVDKPRTDVRHTHYITYITIFNELYYRELNQCMGDTEIIWEMVHIIISRTNYQNNNRATFVRFVYK